MGIEIGVGFAFYFLPSILALVRGARDVVAIILVNLLLGWTVIGWIAALIWSLVGAKRYDPYDRYLAQTMPPVQLLPPGQPYQPYPQPGPYPQYPPYPTQYPPPVQGYQPTPPPQSYTPTYLPAPNQPTPPPQLPMDVEARLTALDGLRAAGLISEAEYQEKRFQILARI